MAIIMLVMDQKNNLDRKYTSFFIYNSFLVGSTVTIIFSYKIKSGIRKISLAMVKLVTPLLEKLEKLNMINVKEILIQMIIKLMAF